jgi:hypothetical protein
LFLKKFIPNSYLPHEPFDHSIRIFAKFTRKRFIIIITRSVIIITKKSILIISDILRRGMSTGFYLLLAFLCHEARVLGKVGKE